MTIFFSAGCENDFKEMEKTIIEFDPAFRENLDKRNILREKIAKQELQFSRSKEKIEQQIYLLKTKKGELSRQNAQAIEKIKQQIEPERRQLQRDLIELKRKYDRVAESLSGVNKDIREITKLIEKKEDLSLTREELSTWNDRLSTLRKQRALKESERASLREEINITKMKLRVMRI
jgi:chromosome segregation ATPase